VTTPVTTPEPAPVTVLTDPLFPYQWHLANSGQDTLSSTRPVPGIDLNLDGLHAAGVRGTGVRVAIVDSGLDIRHDDLQANVVAGGSVNFLNASADPTPGASDPDHGTAVAGVVAARGWNGVGGRGVAPEAMLQGFNYIKAQTVANLITSLGGDASSFPVQVFNLSIGAENLEIVPISTTQIEAYDQFLASTRGARGGVYIKAAGNSYASMANVDCSLAQRQGVGCANSNFEAFNNLLAVTVVGAANAAGKRSSHSTPGASVLVAGLGGEYGGHRAQVPGMPDVLYEPAILTTDLSGCDRGYHRNIGISVNALDMVGPSSLDPSCDYTAMFTGTSAATPSVAGVVAMMLQVNPALTQRDVQYLLATTARRVDYPGTPVTYEGLAIDDAWVVNGANRAFSNAFGFGLVDARAAVAAARTGSGLAAPRRLDWQSARPASPEAIPYRDGAGSRGSIPITVNNVLTVETVQVSFSTTHRDPAKLRVTLISPSGTRSILVWPFSGLKPLTGTTAAGFGADLMRSNAFLDEKAQGTWQLEVVDVSAPSGTSTAQFTNWSLRIAGR
jgi:subtilisin family serine protease